MDQVDTRRSANGEREGARRHGSLIWVMKTLAISAASPATDFTLATRRAALSRLVESARALVLMLAKNTRRWGRAAISPLEAHKNAPHNRGL